MIPGAQLDAPEFPNSGVTMNLYNCSKICHDYRRSKKFQTSSLQDTALTCRYGASSKIELSLSIDVRSVVIAFKV